MAHRTSSGWGHPGDSLEMSKMAYSNEAPYNDSYCQRQPDDFNNDSYRVVAMGDTNGGSILCTPGQQDHAPSHLSYGTVEGNKGVSGGRGTLPRRNKTPRFAGAVGAISSFIYNPNDGRILNRQPIDFLKLLLFYFGFYGAIVAFFSLCFTAFTFAVLNDDHPLRTGEHSLLRLQPGLSIRPVPDWRTTLIRFEMGKEQSFQLYTQNMQAYIDQYENFAQLEQPDVRQTECDISTGIRADPDLRAVCKFDLKELQECNKESMYGYARGQPCVIIKMNKVYGWLPDPATVNNVTNKDILVKCYGIDSADVDFLNHVRYFPSKIINGEEYGFFSHTFYPYLVQAGYLPPVVMAQFTNMTKNRLIRVECRLTGIKNMIYDPMKKLGSMRFEIIMD